MKKTLLILCILAGFTSQAQLVFTNTSAGRYTVTFTPDASVADQSGYGDPFTPTNPSANLYLALTILPADNSGTGEYVDDTSLVSSTGLTVLTGDGQNNWTGLLNLNAHNFTQTNNTIPTGTTISSFQLYLGNATGSEAAEDLQVFVGAHGFTTTTTATETFVLVPDTKFEEILIAQNIDKDPTPDGKILTADALAVANLDVSNIAFGTAKITGTISDLTGIEAFTNLQVLNCSLNKIRNLDLHSNTNLIVLHAEGNGMTTLNVQNGNNAVMDASVASNSQVGYWMTGNNLFCVTTDPFAAFSTLSIPGVPTSAPTSFHIDASVRGFSPTACNDLDMTPFLAGFPAEIVTILNTQANTNGGSLTLGEVIAFVGALDLSTIPGGVSDLTFLDAFTSITGLNLANSTFSSIDLSKYPDLANLDLTGNTTLASLDASTLAALQTLIADGNAALTELLLTGSMTGLTTVNCPLLGTINLSDLGQLTTLIATGNALLTSLTMPGQSVPRPKSGLSNKISATNSTLTTVDLHGNGLTGTLDLTSYSALTSIKVNDNSLTGLNVGNGNNSNISTANFDATGNNLTQIIVDDVNYATTNWTSKVDAGVTFSAGGVLGIDNNILASKINIYPNPTKGLLNVNVPEGFSINSISVFDVTGKQVRFNNGVTKTLDLNNLAKGFYILKIKTNKGLVSKKVLKY